MRKEPNLRIEEYRFCPPGWESPAGVSYGAFDIPFRGVRLHVISSGTDEEHGWPLDQADPAMRPAMVRTRSAMSCCSSMRMRACASRPCGIAGRSSGSSATAVGTSSGSGIYLRRPANR